MTQIKLVKIQREILTEAIESEIRYGIRKPIKVAHPDDLARIDEFNKSFARYHKKMEILINSGWIKRDGDYFAYIPDIKAVANLLKSS